MNETLQFALDKFQASQIKERQNDFAQMEEQRQTMVADFRKMKEDEDRRAFQEDMRMITQCEQIQQAPNANKSMLLDGIHKMFDGRKQEEIDQIDA